MSTKVQKAEETRARFHRGLTSRAISSSAREMPDDSIRVTLKGGFVNLDGIVNALLQKNRRSLRERNRRHERLVITPNGG
jgi:hypothetical protein